MRILAVEPNEGDALRIRRDLKRAGHDVAVVENGSSAVDGCDDVDLVVLELDLPDSDGVHVCREIRQGSEVPIIVLTGRVSEVDCVLSLQAGSDDFVAKPWSVPELRARVDAVTRRWRTSPPPETVTHDVLRINSAAHEVLVGDRRVELTPKEFEVLLLLASEPRLVVSRERLMSDVWNTTSTPSNRRTVDTHVHSVRHKLGSRDWIVTVRGLGYKMGCSPSTSDLGAAMT